MSENTNAVQIEHPTMGTSTASVEEVQAGGPQLVVQPHQGDGNPLRFPLDQDPPHPELVKLANMFSELRNLFPSSSPLSGTTQDGGSSGGTAQDGGSSGGSSRRSGQ